MSSFNEFQQMDAPELAVQKKKLASSYHKIIIAKIRLSLRRNTSKTTKTTHNDGYWVN